MEREEEECYDTGDDFYDSREEDDEWRTAAGSNSFAFDGESEGEQRKLQISVPRRQSVSIVFQRIEEAERDESERVELGTRELEISVPRSVSSLKLLIGRSLPVAPDSEPKREEDLHDDTSLSDSSSGCSGHASTSRSFPESLENLEAAAEDREDDGENSDKSSQASAGASTSSVRAEEEQDEAASDDRETPDSAGRASEDFSKTLENSLRFADFQQEPEKKPLRFADDTELEIERCSSEADVPSTSAETTAAGRSLRFAIIETDEDEKAEKVSAKKSLRFAPDEVGEKRSLRFADQDTTDEHEKVGAKRSLRFADPDTPSSPSKSARFAEGAKSRRSVRFTDDVPGESRKYSINPPVMWKQVRFLVPTMDATGKQVNRVVFPGAPKRKRRDTIKETTVEIYPDPPLWLVLYMMDSKRFSHMTGPWQAFACQVFCWITVVVFVMAFILGMVLLIIYIHVRPQIPILNIDTLDHLDFTLIVIDETYIREQQIEDDGSYFNYEVQTYCGVYVSYWNDNDHFDIDNDYLEMTLLYRGVVFGKTSVRNFFVERGNRTTLFFLIFQESRMLDLRVGYSLEEDMKIDRFDMIFEFVLKARMMPLAFLTTSKVFWSRVRCDIILTRESIQAGNCKYHNHYKF